MPSPLRRPAHLAWIASQRARCAEYELGETLAWEREGDADTALVTSIALSHAITAELQWLASATCMLLWALGGASACRGEDGGVGNEEQEHARVAEEDAQRRSRRAK